MKPEFGQCLSHLIRYMARNYGAAQRAVFPGASTATSAVLLVNGNQALPALLEMIGAARSSIRWQVMLFHADTAGNTLARALSRAAQRGVRVQLSFNIAQTVNGTLADRRPVHKKTGRGQAMEKMLKMLRDAGVEVRPNPAGIHFPLDTAGPRARAIQREIQRSACISANHYDHRKLLIIDDRQAVIGGMNVGDAYLYTIPPDLRLKMPVEARLRQQQGQPEAWEKWLDAGVVLEGPVVREFSEAFNWKWEVLGGVPLPPAPFDFVNAGSGIPVQFLNQDPGRREIGARFLELAAGAQKEIYVASPFVSYEPALAALQAASRRGVRVSFVYPYAQNEMKLSAQIFMHSASGLLEDGVQLYFNDLRMAHTKLLVVDGRWTLAGSFNLNYRSFQHDNEAAVLIEDEAFASGVIEQVFLPYLDFSRRITALPARPWNLLHWIIAPFT